LTKFLLPLVCLAASLPLFAQTAVLSGRVTDESGAVVPGAMVRVQRAGSADKVAMTKAQGTYMINELALGEAVVIATAEHLELAAPIKIALKAGVNALDLPLKITNITQRVTVQDDAGPNVSVETASNASATIISGKDLDALSDDPQDLADDLAALAGPAA
jgi:hypothetical protein